MHENGLGVECDFKKAFKYYEYFSILKQFKISSLNLLKIESQLKENMTMP
jgi:hypothetical protein